MKEEKAGKFCTHCSKNVIDLTRLSDSQILKIIKNNSEGICGRLTRDQSEREIVLPSKSGIRLWYSKIVAGFLLLIASKKAIADVFQQQEIVKTIQVAVGSEDKARETKCVSDTLMKKIHGRVIEVGSKFPLAGATVTIKNTKLSVPANAGGEFEFSVPDILLPKKIILVVSCIGYQTTEFTVRKKKLEKGKSLLIKSEISVLGYIAFRQILKP